MDNIYGYLSTSKICLLRNDFLLYFKSPSSFHWSKESTHKPFSLWGAWGESPISTKRSNAAQWCLSSWVRLPNQSGHHSKQIEDFKRLAERHTHQSLVRCRTPKGRERNSILQKEPLLTPTIPSWPWKWTNIVRRCHSTSASEGVCNIFASPGINNQLKPPLNQSNFKVPGRIVASSSGWAWTSVGSLEEPGRTG